ncbi:hypothetical protein MLD38_034016 [Melastoma candidum]|uniref:Uncharacterized protein n=1 Tax=Melastoma candidum TaxID=119954 RepID=A0ACB9M8L9_9MYRT|nr:hypothetical protein MLD38_034016 [Melastoma candidum]
MLSPYVADVVKLRSLTANRNRSKEDRLDKRVDYTSTKFWARGFQLLLGEECDVKSSLAVGLRNETLFVPFSSEDPSLLAAVERKLRGDKGCQIMRRRR